MGRGTQCRGSLEAVALSRSAKASNKAKAMELKSTGGLRECLGSKTQSLDRRAKGREERGVIQSFPPEVTKNMVRTLAS